MAANGLGADGLGRAQLAGRRPGLRGLALMGGDGPPKAMPAIRDPPAARIVSVSPMPTASGAVGSRRECCHAVPRWSWTARAGPVQVGCCWSRAVRFNLRALFPGRENLTGPRPGSRANIRDSPHPPPPTSPAGASVGYGPAARLRACARARVPARVSAALGGGGLPPPRQRVGVGVLARASGTCAFEKLHHLNRFVRTNLINRFVIHYI
jgi:hypothetical protein